MSSRRTKPPDVPELLWKSGDAFLPPSLVKFLDTYIVGDEHTLVYINVWSIVHLITGFFIGKVFSTLGYVGALAIHTTWEFWQILIKMTKVNTRGMLDTLMDTAMFMIGFALSRN